MTEDLSGGIRSSTLESELALLVNPIEPDIRRSSRQEVAPSQAGVWRPLPLACLNIASLLIAIASLVLLLNASSATTVGPIQSHVAESPSTSLDPAWLDVPADPGFIGGLRGLPQGDRRALMRLKHARQLGRLGAKDMAVCVFPPYAASQVTKHAVEAIQRDYGEDADKLFATMHFINRDVIQRKLVRAVLQPYGDGEDANPFVIAFAGTSVTAGHDNFFNQSYPLVFERELSRSFTAAGIDLVVRNHAMGNNPAMPSCFCVGSQLGSDTDVAVWEFGMMVQGFDRVVSLETWLRNALFLPKQPAIMVLDPGEGERGPKKDTTLQTEPYIPTPPDWSRGFSDKGGRDLLRYYERFGIHAQAMFEATRPLAVTNERYGWSTLVNKDKVYGFRNWHPGPHGHELRGRILAYHYLRLLQDALDDVYFAVSDGQFANLVELERYELPPPMSCNIKICGHPTKCASTYEPHTESGLLNYVTEPDKVATNRSDVNEDNNQWHVQLFENDQGAVRDAKKHGLGYLDRKYTLQATKKAGPLSFKIISGASGHIVLCQPPGVWGKYPDNALFLTSNDTEIFIDNQPMPIGDHEWAANHSVDSSVCVFSRDTFPPGEHILTISSASDDKYVMLSTLVWPA